MSLAPVRTLVSIAILAACASGAGCSKAKRRPPPGKPVTFDTVCNEPSGTAVQLTGYFRYTRSMSGFFCETRDDRMTCAMSLYETGGEPPSNDIDDIIKPDPPKEIRHLQVTVPVGSSPGEMSKLPKRFSADQVHLHLEKGGRADEGGKVTIDGIVTSYPGQAPIGSRMACNITMTWAAS